MKTVHIVFYSMYAGEGEFIVGVFSTKKKADDFIASLRNPDRHYIIECEIDTPNAGHVDIFRKDKSHAAR